MAKGIRATMTATDARTLIRLCIAASASEDAAALALAEALQRGLNAHHARGANARARRAEARAAKAAEPVYRHFEVDGYRVSALQADWFDASRDPDARQWQRIRRDEPWQTVPDQCEHRPGWWMVYVWPIEPERSGPLGDRLVQHLSNIDHAARAIVQEALGTAS